ncbi:hypothetical protein niasHT_007311 [Heterodera trifolii]|uniref:Uncharacterized protein n=1 Tax=Heterodera trifolii TaxID=157864 RepID=A0ABD2LLA6_9BILA
MENGTGNGRRGKGETKEGEKGTGKWDGERLVERERMLRPLRGFGCPSADECPLRPPPPALFIDAFALSFAHRPVKSCNGIHLEEGKDRIDHIHCEAKLEMSGRTQ